MDMVDRWSRICNLSADMHGYRRIYSQTIGTGFTDEKDAQGK